MMRSKRYRAMTPLQWLTYNPFLTVAIVSVLALAAMESGIDSERVLERFWLVLGFGFHTASNLVTGLLPDLQDSLELALIAITGLALYLLLDSVWRRLRP